MRIVVRADASIKIGSGHIMRCLTLANALQAKGAEVYFICREHNGNLTNFIQEKGYKTFRLKNNIIKNNKHTQLDKIKGKNTRLYHENWLGGEQEQDAADCKPILEKIIPDWLIVDHYALDQRWETMLKRYYKKLMVIDDLADRSHQCDMLLDQTYGRNIDDYKNLIPERCQLLLGSQFALIRPEFARWREYSLKRRNNPKIKKLLITMGGVDPCNVTGQILTILADCDLPENLEITVIMGETAPHLENIKALTDSMNYHLLINVDNMAEIMANSDLAIGAAGATTWERCCLGLPSLLVILSENQKKIANILEEHGVIVNLGQFNYLDKLKLFFKRQIPARCISKLSSRSAEIVDGNGMRLIRDRLLYG